MKKVAHSEELPPSYLQLSKGPMDIIAHYDMASKRVLYAECSTDLPTLVAELQRFSLSDLVRMVAKESAIQVLWSRLVQIQKQCCATLNIFSNESETATPLGPGAALLDGWSTTDASMVDQSSRVMRCTKKELWSPLLFVPQDNHLYSEESDWCPWCSYAQEDRPCNPVPVRFLPSSGQQEDLNTSLPIYCCTAKNCSLVSNRRQPQCPVCVNATMSLNCMVLRCKGTTDCFGVKGSTTFLVSPKIPIKTYPSTGTLSKVVSISALHSSGMYMTEVAKVEDAKALRTLIKQRGLDLSSFTLEEDEVDLGLPIFKCYNCGKGLSNTFGLSCKQCSSPMKLWCTIVSFSACSTCEEVMWHPIAPDWTVDGCGHNEGTRADCNLEHVSGLGGGRKMPSGLCLLSDFLCQYPLGFEKELLQCLGSASSGEIFSRYPVSLGQKEILHMACLMKQHDCEGVLTGSIFHLLPPCPQDNFNKRCLQEPPKVGDGPRVVPTSRLRKALIFCVSALCLVCVLLFLKDKFTPLKFSQLDNFQLKFDEPTCTADVFSAASLPTEILPEEVTSAAAVPEEALPPPYVLSTEVFSTNDLASDPPGLDGLNVASTSLLWQGLIIFISGMGHVWFVLCLKEMWDGTRDFLLVTATAWCLCIIVASWIYFMN